VGDRFLRLACQGGNSPLWPRQLRHWLWSIVFTYSELSLYSTATRCDLVAWLSLWAGLQVV